MENFVIYLIKVNVVILALFVVYFLFLKNEKFFRINRFFFLSSLVLSFILPLFPAVHLFSINGFEKFQDQVSSVNPFFGIQKGAGEGKPAIPIHAVNAGHEPVFGLLSGISTGQLLAGIYLMISIVLLLRFGYQLVSLFYLFRGKKERLANGILCFNHDKEISPFSFFRCLVINRSLFNNTQYAQIIEHEKMHIQGWHSVDILLAELANILLWMNPMLKAFKQSIKLNLEYIADEGALGTGIDRKSYQICLLQCLKPSSPALANLFNSSKLKKRILMMNTAKTPTRHLYKYVFMLPALFISYFLIHPFQSRASGFYDPGNMTLSKSGQMNAIAGYYQFQNNKRQFLLISEKENHWTALQLWDGREFSIDPKFDPGFSENGNWATAKSGNDNSFYFLRNKSGAITQLLAKHQDLWDKIPNYTLKPGMDTVISPAQLKTFEGYYTFQFNKGDDAYIHIAAEPTGLVLKQMWDGKEIHFTAQSALEFLNQDGEFPLKFTKDKNGIISQVLAFNRDLWTRTKEYKPKEIKVVHLSAALLKACAGKYSMHDDGKEAYLEIRVVENNLVLKQMWDEKEFMFVPESELDFYCREANFPIKFTKDKNGNATQVLCFNRDLWSRVRE